jgi:Heterokaryon incompatibility protein (HET)
MKAVGTGWISSDNYFEWLKSRHIGAGVSTWNESKGRCERELQRWLHRRSARHDSIDHYEMDLQRSLHGRWVLGDFLAISYVLGESTEGRNVVVNGAAHPVTDNLYQILQMLWLDRNPEISDLRLFGCGLWVDAICIYLGRSVTKSCRNLRVAPLFYKGLVFAFRGPSLGVLSPTFT